MLLIFLFKIFEISLRFIARNSFRNYYILFVIHVFIIQNYVKNFLKLKII